MRASWHALHAGLTRSTSILRFQHRFEALRQDDPDLARFKDPADLFDWLHAPTGDGASRNGVLRALICASKQSKEPAVTLLMLALWPGLDAVRWRLGAAFRGRRDEIDSELAAQAVHAIDAFDVCRASWVAATILRNIERDLRRKFRRESGHEAHELYREDSVSLANPSVFASPPCADADRDAAILIDRLRPVVGVDATLVVAVAVGGMRQHEVAAVAGCTPAAARKRYQRALARLRQKFRDAA